MNRYGVKKIDLSKAKTPEEYQKAIENAIPQYYDGLNEVWQYCGGRLHRERYGYSGINGNIEYIVERI